MAFAFPRGARGAWFLVAVAGLVAVFTAFVWRSDGAPHAAAPTVAFVNGTPITANDLDLRVSQILPQASYHGRIAPERLAALERAALDELILDELVHREALAAGRRPSSSAVDAEIEAAKARFESADAFAAALRANGLDETAFRERLGRSILVREARSAHEVCNVSEAEIAAYYRANGSKFQRPERVRLRQILFRVDPADPSSAGPAASKAHAALERLRRGEPFGPLARRTSEDEYRVKDGDMGFVHRGRLDPEFEEAVFAAPIGKPRVARSLYGFEVFEVLERQPATQLGLDDARPIIAGRLTRQRRTDGLRAWKVSLLANAHVQIRDAVLRRAQPAELPGADEMPAIWPRQRGTAGSER